MNEIAKRRPDHLTLAEAEDALHRGALILNDPVATDKRDHVGGVLDQGPEVFLAFGQSRRVRLQRSVQRQVVVEGQELADHDEPDDDQQAPEDHRIELAWLQLLDCGDHRRRPDR